MTLLANASLPSLVLLEDANDLYAFFEAMNRTVPRHLWVKSIIDEINNEANESIF